MRRRVGGGVSSLDGPVSVAAESPLDWRGKQHLGARLPQFGSIHFPRQYSFRFYRKVKGGFFYFVKSTRMLCENITRNGENHFLPVSHNNAAPELSKGETQCFQSSSEGASGRTSVSCGWQA